MYAYTLSSIDTLLMCGHPLLERNMHARWSVSCTVFACSKLCVIHIKLSDSILNP